MTPVDSIVYIVDDLERQSHATREVADKSYTILVPNRMGGVWTTIHLTRFVRLIIPFQFSRQWQIIISTSILVC